MGDSSSASRVGSRGESMKAIHRVVWVLIFVVIGVSCTKTHSVKVIQAAPTHVETTVTTISTGTVEAEKNTPLAFTGTGRVAAVLIRVGDRVRKGQILAHLDHADLKSAFEESESEWSRTQELFKEGLVSKAALDSAKRALEGARANFEKSMIRAAFDGMVTELNLEVGELAGPASSSSGKTQIRLVDLQPRIVTGEIDEIDLAKVKVGCRARIKINAVGAQPFEAKVSRVVPFISSTKDQDRTSRIELKVEKNNQLLPVGASADIEIVTDEKENALAVPSRALVGVRSERSVYVLDQGKAKKVRVQTGIGNYEKTEILSGIQAGERVILPAEDFVLTEGAKVTAEEQKWP